MTFAALSALATLLCLGNVPPARRVVDWHDDPFHREASRDFVVTGWLTLADLRECDVAIAQPSGKPWIEERIQSDGTSRGKPFLVGLQKFTILVGSDKKEKEVTLVNGVHKNWGEPMPKLNPVLQRTYLLIYRRSHQGEFRLGTDLFGINLRAGEGNFVTAYPGERMPLRVLWTDLKALPLASDPAERLLFAMIESVPCVGSASQDALTAFAETQPVLGSEVGPNGSWYWSPGPPPEVTIGGKSVLDWYRLNAWPMLHKLAASSTSRRSEILDLLIKWGDATALFEKQHPPDKPTGP